LQRLKVSLGAAVAHEGERLAVRRPRWLNVRVPIVRQLARRAAGQIEQVQIADAASLTGQGERPTVRRPRHRAHGTDPRELDAPLDARGPRVENGDLVVAIRVDDEGELAAVRRPITR